MYNIEELVGPSLQEVFVKYQQSTFSPSTIALIGIQVVRFAKTAQKAPKSSQSWSHSQRTNSGENSTVLQDNRNEPLLGRPSGCEKD